MMPSVGSAVQGSAQDNFTQRPGPIRNPSLLELHTILGMEVPETIHCHAFRTELTKIASQKILWIKQFAAEFLDFIFPTREKFRCQRKLPQEQYMHLSGSMNVKDHCMFSEGGWVPS